MRLLLVIHAGLSGSLSAPLIRRGFIPPPRVLGIGVRATFPECGTGARAYNQVHGVAGGAAGARRATPASITYPGRVWLNLKFFQVR